MHLEHDGCAHDHGHEHEHTHADGTTHSHVHTHDDGAHTHTHCDQAPECAGCQQGQYTPRQELMALMKYMVGHNASHAKELADLAEKVKSLGDDSAYEQIMLAVSDFEKGNLRLSTVLAAMKE
ncbi:MAG: cobalt transporter [Firmicutes bacterium]|nr:cobalt transporter [Bacillota bacterium]